MMLEVFPSRQEFVTVLEELRALREESNRRFEVVERRFEAVDRRFEELRTDMNQRFEALLATLQEHTQQLRIHSQQLREHFLHLSSLGGRLGYGPESLVKAVVEEFAGQTFPAADRLILWDDRGEVFGVPKAEIEFDSYVHDSRDYLVEVKSHLKVSDVLAFHRKVQFAREKMGRSFIPLIIALSMDTKAEPQMQALGIRYRIGPGGVVAESSSPS